MRPFVSFFTFFSFFSVAALVAARTDIISSLDKQITYAGANWRTVSLRVTWVARYILTFDLPRLTLLEVDSCISEMVLVARL